MGGPVEARSTVEPQIRPGWAAAGPGELAMGGREDAADPGRARFGCGSIGGLGFFFRVL